MRITNGVINKDVVPGKKYLITDDFYYRKECTVVDHGDKLVIAEYDLGLDEIIFDVTENTPTLYVIINGTEIPTLIEDVVELIEIA